MHDPNDRDHQQRELTEELRHDAHLRAERTRRVAAVPEQPAGAPHAAAHEPRADPEPPAWREPPPPPPRNPCTGARPAG